MLGCPLRLKWLKFNSVIKSVLSKRPSEASLRDNISTILGALTLADAQIFTTEPTFNSTQYVPQTRIKKNISHNVKIIQEIEEVEEILEMEIENKKSEIAEQFQKKRKNRRRCKEVSLRDLPAWEDKDEDKDDGDGRSNNNNVYRRPEQRIKINLDFLNFRERTLFTFFAQIELIEKSSDLFEILEKEELYFSYFKSNKFYYLFVYGKNDLFNHFNKILSSLVVIEELDTKKRKIRSIRGFLLQALEIIQDEKQIKVFKTNFQPLFWNRVQTVIRQNKKNGLLEFLFGFSNSSNLDDDQESKQVIKKMETLENKIRLLEEKIDRLSESETKNPIQMTYELTDGNLVPQHFISLTGTQK